MCNYADMNAFKKWLRRTGQTIRGFARASGISPSMVSQLASCSRRPGRDNAILIEDLTIGEVRASGWGSKLRRRSTSKKTARTA